MKAFIYSNYQKIYLLRLKTQKGFKVLTFPAKKILNVTILKQTWDTQIICTSENQRITHTDNDITRLGTVKWILEESAESLFLSNREEEGRAFPETGAIFCICQDALLMSQLLVNGKGWGSRRSTPLCSRPWNHKLSVFLYFCLQERAALCEEKISKKISELVEKFQENEKKLSFTET